MKSRMRRTSASVDVTHSEQSGSDETLHANNSKSLDVCVSESRIDRMRKLLSSPLLRRKPNYHKTITQSSQCESKVFGVSLDVLSHSNTSEEPFIPFVVTRLCHFIEDSGGFLQEGLFRISGNAKMIDKLKHSFDNTGDANLESEGDIASASALLKQFLRELPQPLIPDTSQFLEAIKNYETDERKCIHNLRALVSRLADENYYTLKYLSAFLNRIALQKENRMTSANLGIVFAPNMFKVNVDTYKGLREQSMANEVVTLFIDHFTNIFNIDLTDSIFTTVFAMSPLTVEIPDPNPISADSDENQLSIEIPSLLLHNTSQESRKRKESKCLSNSPPFRSNSEETLIDSKDKDIRRCSSDENLLNTEFITAVNKFENLNFRNTSSPHPPEAKRRELDTDERCSAYDSQLHCISDTSDQFDDQCNQKQPNISCQSVNLCSDLIDNMDSYKENCSENNDNESNVIFKTCQISQTNDDRNCRTLVEITPIDNQNNNNINNNNNYSNKDEIDNKDKIPHLDFKTVFQNIDISEPILSEHRYSWPRSSHESESAITSDNLAPNPSTSVSQFLKKAVSYEAPLSPSAYRNYLSNRSVHLDPTIPPSPPVEQMKIRAPIRDIKQNELINTSIRSITKKIQNVKKKLKHFEYEFEKEKGFRPSLEQKMSCPEGRALVLEMNRLKKDLKEFKDDLYMESIDKQNLLPNETKEFNCSKSLINISETIKEIERTIEDKRKAANRPEILEEMTSEEIIEEKLTLQKALLRFEALYGRPTTKAEREIVRPLYDRYRIVKRMVAKTMPPKVGSKESAELQPILEHIAMDFTSPSHSKSEAMASIQITNSSDNTLFGAITDEMITNSKSNKELKTIQFSNLHEMSLSELNHLLNETRLQKRNLRTVLRDFENDFMRIMGRKVEKEDKVNMGSVYSNYKHTKGKLRLLEALVSKHESQLIML
ncbi:protein FAM13A-like [Oppia nitens]|uniref:protein FAM13A-like n=1 Tax=Oppia nitens TaxID=1686743 RepID=UPI0023DAE14F|nr:protein FAM13A-like [Oppia nitens]